jgi:hypothetical protein
MLHPVFFYFAGAGVAFSSQFTLGFAFGVNWASVVVSATRRQGYRRQKEENIDFFHLINL